MFHATTQLASRRASAGTSCANIIWLCHSASCAMHHAQFAASCGNDSPLELDSGITADAKTAAYRAPLRRRDSPPQRAKAAVVAAAQWAALSTLASPHSALRSDKMYLRSFPAR